MNTMKRKCFAAFRAGLCLMTFGILSTFQHLHASGETPVPGGKVRYAIELRTVTMQQAQQYKSDGYVDLWAYALFNQAFVDKGYISGNLNNGTMTAFKIGMQLNTHSFKMVYKNGADDKRAKDDAANAVAALASPYYADLNGCLGTVRQPSATASNAYDSDGNLLPDDGEGAVPMDFTKMCWTWEGGGSSSRSNQISGGENAKANLRVITDAAGNKWYALRMYKIRFRYFQTKSFYATFYKDNAAGGASSASTGASNFNIMSGNDKLVPGDWNDACWANVDWSMKWKWGDEMTCAQEATPNAFGFIQGGLEVISVPTFEAKTTPACPGADMTGTFKVLDWSGADWSKFKTSANGGFKVYVNKTGQAGSARKEVAGANIAYTGNLNTLPGTNSSADNFTFTLKPGTPGSSQGYLWGANTSADTLIFRLTDADGKVTDVKTVLSLKTVPKFYFAATDAATANAARQDGTFLAQNPVGTIVVGETTKIHAKWTSPNRVTTARPGEVADFTGFAKVPLSSLKLWRSETKNGTYTNTLTGTLSSQSLKDQFVGTSGYYYLEGIYDGCPFTTDTVFIKVKKPLVAPSLSTDLDCGVSVKLKASASNATADPTEWQWVIRTSVSDMTKVDDQTSGIGLTVKNNENKIVSNGMGSYTLEWKSTPAGKDCDLKFSTTYQTGSNASAPIICFGLIPSETATGVTGWVWNKTGSTSPLVYILPGKVAYVRYKLDGEWSPWAFYLFPQDVSNACNGAPQNPGTYSPSAIPPMYAPPVDFTNFSIGISAQQTGLGNITNATYRPFFTKTDTMVEPGTVIKFRTYLSGVIMWNATKAYDFTTTSSVSLNYAYAPMVIYWQEWDKTNKKWVTWDVTSSYNTTSIEKGLVHYVESSPRIITDAGDYRAVISIAQDCKTVTTTSAADKTTYPMADDPYTEGKANDPIYPIGKPQIGTFADVAHVTLRGKVNPGDLKGSPDGGAYSVNEGIICNKLDLKVEGNVGTNQTFKYQWAKPKADGTVDETTWTNTPVTTSTFTNAQAYIEMMTGATADDFYKGCVRFFRVEVSENMGGVMEKAYTNEYKVTWYKVKTYGLAETTNPKRTFEQGYCYGTQVELKVNNGTAIPTTTAGSGTTGYFVQYLRSATNLASNAQNFPSSGNVLTGTNNTYKDVMNGFFYNYYRGVYYNGPSDNKSKCVAYKDTVKIMHHPKVTINMPAVRDTCTMTTLTLTASSTFTPATGITGTPAYQWQQPEQGSVSAPKTSGDVKVNGAASDATSLQFPYSWYKNTSSSMYEDKLRVIVTTTFKNGSSAATACKDTSATITVKTKDCAKDAPVPNPTSLCNGASDVTLTWADVFDASKLTLKMQNPGGSWVSLTNNTDFTFTTASGSTTFTVKKAKMTANGKYKFRIDMGSAPGGESAEVTVKPMPTKPTVVASATPNPICEGATLNLKATPTPASQTGVTYTYAWTGPSFTNATQNPTRTSVTTAMGGTYNVTVKASQDGCEVTSDPGTIAVTVNPKPTKPTLSGLANKTVCAGENGSLAVTVNPATAAPSGSTYTYKWTKGSTAVGTNAATLTINPAATSDAGTYNIKVLVATSAGCKDSATATAVLTVNAIPTINPITITPTPANAKYCSGDNIKLAATVTPAPATGITATYRWFKGSNATDTLAANLVSDQTTATFTKNSSVVADQGTYILVVTYKQGNCATKAMKEQAITVKQKPAITGLSMPINQPICVGQTPVVFTPTINPTAAATGTYSYKWEKGSTVISGATNPTYTPPAGDAASAGTITYKFTVTETNDYCTDSKSGTVNLIVNANPSGQAVAMDAKQYCSDDAAKTLTATATATTGSPSKYEWFKGATATGSPENTTTTGTYTPTGVTAPTDAAPVQSEDYTVKVTFGANGCEATATKTAKITIVKKPATPAVAFTPTSKTVCQGEAVNITGNVTPTNNGTYTYTWTTNPTTIPSGTVSNTSTNISISSAAVNQTGTYTLKAKAEQKDNASGKTCAAEASGSVQITVNAIPNLTGVGATGTTDYCSGENISLTAAGTPSPASGVTATYRWYQANSLSDTSASNRKSTAAALTINNATTAADGKYIMVVTYKTGNCPVSVSAEKTINVVQKPSVTAITIAPTTATVCKNNPQQFVASGGTVSGNAAAGNGNSVTKKWSINGTDNAETSTTINAVTTATGTFTYKYKVEAINYLNASKNCTDSKEGTATLKVVDSVNLSGLSVASVNGCVTDPTALKLSVSGTIPSGATFQWKKGGVNVSTGTGGTTKDYTPVKELASNGSYTCVVTVPSTSAIPCQSQRTLGPVTLEYKMCGDEALTPGSEDKPGQEKQGSAIALICNDQKAASKSYVTFEPIAEKAAVTKVSWYKSTNNFTTGVTGGTQIGSDITSFTWPLKLSQNQVFDAGDAANKHYYIRAKIERGSIVSYSSIYRFALVKNPAPLTVSVTPTDAKICFSGATTQDFTATPSALANPVTTPLPSDVTAKKTNNDGITYMWKKPTSPTDNPAFAAASTVNPNALTITQAGVYVVSAHVVSAYTYELGATNLTCYDTSATPGSGKVTATLPPVLNAVKDAAGNQTSTICASETTYPKLTPDYDNTRGSIVKWEKSVNGAAYSTMTAAGTSASYQLVEADVTKPAAGATSNNTIKYRVTVKNESCPEISKEYTLVITPLPDFATATVSGGGTFCKTTPPTLTAKGAKANGTEITTNISYKWQKSTDGTTWTDVPSGTAKTLSLTDVANSGKYRCVIKTPTTGSCAKELTSDPVDVTIDPETAVGTIAAVNPVCTNASAGPQFNLDSKTGNITKWEVSNTNAFTAGTNVTKTLSGTGNPYTLNLSDVTNLLSSSSRKTTLYMRVTVKSGACPEKTATQSIDIYKPAPTLVLQNIDPMCTNKGLAPGATAGYTPATESGFEEITWTITNSAGATVKTLTGPTPNIPYTDLAPKYNNDTAYKISATVKNTKVSTCGPTTSNVIEFKVNRQPKMPAKIADQTVCEGQPYTIWAKRPAQSALTWQKDGAALPSAETPVVTGNEEKITVNSAVFRTAPYVYKATDKACNREETATINVTVKQKPKAGSIAASEPGGDFCSGATVTVNATAGSYTIPAGKQMEWQVCTDTVQANANGATRVAGLEMTGTTYSKASTLFTAGTQYFVRYKITGESPCTEAYSPWVPVKVTATPTIGSFTASNNGAHVCEGTDVTLTVNGAEGLQYQFYTNTANNNTSGTAATGTGNNGTIPASGSATYTFTPPAGASYYYVKLTSTNTSNASCKTSAPSTPSTVNVDAKPVGGKLVITAPTTALPDIDLAADGKRLKTTTGTTAQLRLDNSAPASATKALKGVSDKGSPVSGSVAANNTASLALTTAHMDNTRLWVEVKNGVCPPAYSDTVNINVILNDKPTLSVSKICKGSATTLKITIPTDDLKNKLDEHKKDLSLEYKASAASTWSPVTGASFGTADGTAPNITIAITEALSATLDPGTYDFRVNYNTGDGIKQSNTATLTVVAPSVGGTLAVDKPIVCQGSTPAPNLTLSGNTGTVTALKFSTAENGSFTQKSTSLPYDVPTTDVANTGWYQATVKNDLCPEATSNKVKVTIITKPVAGSLNDPTVCFGANATLNYTGGTGDSIIWKTSNAFNGTYTNVPNTNQRSYTLNNMTDHLWVKVAVTTNKVCALVESDAKEVKVYDTLKFTLQPLNPKSVMENTDATLTVTAAKAGLLYNPTGNFADVSASSYQWQRKIDNGAWTDISDGAEFSGTATATLTIKAAKTADNDITKKVSFRCVVKDNRNCRTINSNPGSIKLQTDLTPGKTNSLTACECYYTTDQATYFVTEQNGQGTLKYRWEVQLDGSSGWERLENLFTDLSTVCKGADKDTIVFFRIGELYVGKNVRRIRAVVSDDIKTAGMPTTDKDVEVCIETKPKYTFKGNIVCEGTATSEVKFEKTANPNHIDKRSITYDYALKTAPGTFKPITIPNTADATTTVVGLSTNTLIFTVKKADTSLVIPSGTVIPFEADSMIIRMHVRSCYTPNPTVNTDTTIAVLLRVDKKPAVDLIRDTTICKGSSVTLLAKYTLANATIPGNTLTMQITPGGAPSTVNADLPAEKTLSYLVSPSTTTKYKAEGYTKYCTDKVSDEATVTVKEIPVLASIKADSVCVNGDLKFTATITNYDAATCELIWEKQKADGSWEVLVNNGSDKRVYTKNNITTDDAGKYRLTLKKKLPTCGTDEKQEFTFKVMVTPELYLSPAPYPGNIAVQKTKTKDMTAENKTTAQMGYTSPYVILAPISKYEWHIQKNGTGAFEKLIGTNHASFINGAFDAKKITFVGIDGYDKTLFYAKAITACGTPETQKDTLVFTDKFSITDVEVSDILCEGASEFKVTIATTLPPLASKIKWYVSTDNGTTWTPIAAGPVSGQAGAVYVITPPATEQSTMFSMSVTNPTLAMNGWLFKAEAGNADDDDVSTKYKEVKLQIIPKPKFSCADNQVLSKTEPVVVIGGTPASSTFTASCLPGNWTPDPGYQKDFYVRKPGQIDSTKKGSGNTYDFQAESDTGMHKVYFVLSNRCGFVDAEDEVRVIKNPEPGMVTAIDYHPNPTEEDPNKKDKKAEEGPSPDNIEITVCENDSLSLMATYTGGPATSFEWQMEGSAIPIAAPYSLKGDTLIIKPVPYSINGKKFRCKFNMPGNVGAIFSKEITVHVNRVPNMASAPGANDTIGVKIKDEDYVEGSTDPNALKLGQGLPGHSITIEVDYKGSDANKYCFYKYTPAKPEPIIEELQCGLNPSYLLTSAATVEDHDSTLYFARVYNDCGYSETKINLLRIYDTLSIRWIPDTTIQNPSGGWDPKSNTDPKPGQLIVVLRPGEDSVQVDAHLWICQSGLFTVFDTTRSGFMNRETDYEDTEEERIRGSRWLYRNPNETMDWTTLTTFDWPWSELFGFKREAQEHLGTFGFEMPVDPDMDGWQFRALGVNDRYEDTTCILTLHVIPKLEKGTLKMNPEEITACNSTFAEFKLTSATANLSLLKLDWQVKAASDADWSPFIDSLHNDTIYTIGTVGLSYNGYQVRAIAQGACGNDTVEGIIKIQEVGVALKTDTACFGESLLLTATDIGNAGHAGGYRWYINGKLVEGQTGETLNLAGRDAGTYNVRVEIVASATCSAEATGTAVIRPLPTVKAEVTGQNPIKTGSSTEVSSTGTAGATFAWQPAEYVTNPTAATTPTIEFEAPGKYVFRVTATNEYGCQAVDSVEVQVLSNFRLDTIIPTVVIPPVLPNENGTMPGLPGGSYPFNGTGTKPGLPSDAWSIGDEAWVRVCPGNEARVTIVTAGGASPLKYTWRRVDGTAYPRPKYNDTINYYTAPDGVPTGWEGKGPSTTDFVTNDSIIVFFFPDSSTTQFNCTVEDAAGNKLDVKVHVLYHTPELIYIETRPKTTSTKFYEDQAIYFHARPQRFANYWWVRVIGEGENAEVTEQKMTTDPLYSSAFKMENPDEKKNQVWVTAIDYHGCRLWDSTSVKLMELPNVMLINDPTRPLAGVIFPEFEVEITNMWGLRIKDFKDRNSNGNSRGWDGKTPAGVEVVAGTYFYNVKIPTLDGFVYMKGAVTVINRNSKR